MVADRQRAHAVARARGRLITHIRDPLYRNSYFLMGSLVASAGGGFIFWVLAARLAPAEAVGRASALISAVTLLSYLTGLGLPYGLLRYGARDDGLASVMNGALLVSSATSVLASIVFCVGVGLWAPDLTSLVDTPMAVAVFALVNVAVGLTVLLDSFLAARRMAQWAMSRAVLLSAARFVLFVPLIDHGARGIYLAGTIPFVLVTTLSVLVLPRLEPRYRIRRLREWPALRRFFAYSLRTFPSTLLGGAPPFTLPLIVLAILGPRQTAYFFAAWSAVSVALVLPSMVANIALSEGSRENPWAASRRGRRLAMIIVTPVTLLFLLGAKPILSVFGHDYERAAWMLRIFALSLIPWAVMCLDLSAMRVEARYQAMNWTMLTLALSTLIGAVVLGVGLGLDGVALGWTLGNLLTTTGVRLYARDIASRSREEPPAGRDDSAHPGLHAPTPLPEVGTELALDHRPSRQN
jgi:O-antigen/teichoic acid export membrane protein